MATRKNAGSALASLFRPELFYTVSELNDGAKAQHRYGDNMIAWIDPNYVIVSQNGHISSVCHVMQQLNWQSKPFYSPGKPFFTYLRWPGLTSGQRSIWSTSPEYYQRIADNKAPLIQLKTHQVNSYLVVKWLFTSRTLTQLLKRLKTNDKWVK